MAANMGYEFEMESSGDELLLDEPSDVGRFTTRRRSFAVISGLVMLCAAVSLWAHPRVLDQIASGHLIALDDSEASLHGEHDCSDLPFVKLENVISSNLGKKGPDTDAPEGIIYNATARNTGASITSLEIHIHSLKTFNVTEDGDDTYDPDYTPAFKNGAWQGIHGKFACINVDHGTSVKLRAHAFNPETKEDIPLPHGAISFFDLDTGVNNTHSVEQVRITGYTRYWLSNETQVKVEHDEASGFTMFSATKEGTGEDNPSDPLALTEEQKDRAVTIEFEDTPHFDFQIGASEGATGRVFSFVFRPSLLCAKTELHQHLFPATGSKAPIIPIKTATNDDKDAAYAGLPSMMLTAVVLSMLTH
jgi:hypothetical protein